MVAQRLAKIKDLLIVLALLLVLMGEQMSYTDLIMKMANGEPLSDSEKNELALEARKMEQTASFINQMIQPGSSIVKIDHLVANDAKIQDAEIVSATAGGGDILINEYGIFFKNQQGLIDFQTASGQYGLVTMYIDGSDRLSFESNVVDGAVQFFTHGDSAQTYFLFYNLPGYAGLPYFRMSGPSGSFVAVNDQAYLYGEGTNTSTSLFMNTNTNNPPENLNANAAGQIYIRNNKLVIKYNDAGTLRYKYLDLTGTGVTWTHTTVAP